MLAAIVLPAVGLLNVLIVGFVTATLVATAAFAVWTIVVPKVDPASRLTRLTLAVMEEDEGEEAGARRRAFETMAAQIGRYAQTTDVNEVVNLKRTLTYAGFKHRRAIEIFSGLRVAALLLIPVMLAPTAFFLDVSVAAFTMLLGAAFGYYFPLVALSQMAARRQGDILRAYPDALDLMVSSVESGLSLDQAFKRVAAEMRQVSPSLSSEFALVTSQAAAGIDRITALRRLEERTGLDEIRSFVNMLTQAERFGTSVSASLRLYASVAREKRVARAEEKAGQVGTKLTGIMIVFFLPVLMLVLIAPPGLNIYYGEGG